VLVLQRSSMEECGLRAPAPIVLPLMPERAVAIGTVRVPSVGDYVVTAEWPA
jgi:hypothetical protein